MLIIGPSLIDFHLPLNSSIISCPTCTVSLDCNKTVPKALNWLGSSDTVLDSALNGPSAKKPPDLSTSSYVSLEMTPSVYNV